MSLFALFCRKGTRKLPRGERFYVRPVRLNENGQLDAEIKSRKRGQVMFLYGFVDFNAVRVAGKIAKMLNEGELK